MRIAYITETWLPSTDGVITRLLATIKELARLGHEVLVIAPEGGGSGVPGVRVRTVPTISFRWVYGGNPWGLPHPRVARYLDEFRPDVVHLLNPVLIGWAGAAATRRRHYPTVASYHTDLSRYARDYKLSWIVPLLRAHTRKLHSAAQLNLATSSTGRAQLAEHGITDSRLWPAGVDLDTYHPIQPCSVPAGGGRPNALYVGRVAAEKELHHLAPLAARTSPYALTVVGDGPARTEMQNTFGRT
ncbi:MAG: glycosyltransferase, partial [Microlunatus sp.]|nr:glycosyltransferase [Microlunatus sp.]